MSGDKRRSRALLALAFAALIGALCCNVSSAWAGEYGDVMLGVFTNSQNDATDTFYVSFDGVHMEKIGQAFKDLTPNDASSNAAEGSKKDGRTWDLYSFSCPSIIYHDGYFWMLSNEWNSGDDHTLRLVVSNSKDLVHWCDQHQVKVNVPGGVQSNGNGNQFDAVAADWAVSPDGSIYVVVSLGEYGGFHGRPERDVMYPYLVKVTELSDTNDPAATPKDNWRITMRTETARKIDLPLASTNRIDGSLYFEGGDAYLSIKRNGVTNEIWKNNASLSGSWTSVNSNVLTGYEAPCLTKFNGKYYFFTDQISTWTPDSHVRAAYMSNGTHVQVSKSLGAGWTGPTLVSAYASNGTVLTKNEHNNPNGDGPRHGTVITVTDPQAKAVIWNLYKSAGWKSEPPAGTFFTDVYSASSVLSSDATATPHASDIEWMGDTGISKGYPDGTYQGMWPVYRQDMAAFLRREAKLMGVSDAATWKPSDEDWARFTDVNPSTPHAEDILWLAHAGITDGYKNSDGTKRYEGFWPVYRQDMAAFMHRLARLAGKPEPASSGASFSDVTDTTPHAEHIQWMAATGISKGYSDGTYQGMWTVYRQDMAAFLHRLYLLK